MYIWGRNAMESYGTSLSKHRSPWNIVEGELVSMGYIIGRFQKGYKAREREGKRFGVMVGSGSVYSVPLFLQGLCFETSVSGTIQQNLGQKDSYKTSRKVRLILSLWPMA